MLLCGYFDAVKPLTGMMHTWVRSKGQVALPYYLDSSGTSADHFKSWNISPFILPLNSSSRLKSRRLCL